MWQLDLLTAEATAGKMHLGIMYHDRMYPSHITAEVKKAKEYFQPLFFIEASKDFSPGG